MKGQSLVVQFMLFFMIGLGLFITIGGIFRFHSDVLREDVAEASRELISSYISSIAISMASNCKDCNFTTYSLKLQSITANYLTSLNFSTATGLHVSSEPGGGNASASLHNLNESFVLIGNAPSSKSIVLKLNNTSRKQEFNLTYKP